MLKNKGTLDGGNQAPVSSCFPLTECQHASIPEPDIIRNILRMNEKALESEALERRG